MKHVSYLVIGNADVSDLNKILIIFDMSTIHFAKIGYFSPQHWPKLYRANSHHDKIPPWWEYVSNKNGGNSGETVETENMNGKKYIYRVTDSLKARDAGAS